MALYKNTQASRMVVDRHLHAEAVGSKDPSGHPTDVMDLTEAHLQMPGIKAAISDGALVPFEGSKIGKEIKKADDLKKDPPKKQDEKKPEEKKPEEKKDEKKPEEKKPEEKKPEEAK